MAAHFAATSYTQYTLALERKETLKVRLRVARKERQDYEQKERAVIQVNQFVNLARQYGLQQDRWTVFDVNLQEVVTFPEFAEILTQCRTSSAYYFKPVAMHVQIPEKSKEATAKPQTGTRSNDDKATKSPGDVQLTLRGAFLVKQP